VDPYPDFFYADPDPTFHPDAEPDKDPSYLIKALTLEKVVKWLIFHNHIFTCHLQIDTDLDPSYHLDADPDPDF
jgi:hypothetical protein